MKLTILNDRIQNFIDKKDISIKNAQEIDFLLSKLSIDNEVIDDLILMIALYVPGGGDFLLDEDQIIMQLSKAKEILKNLSN
ncbi:MULTISPECIES: hypothetical protein [Acinetobacter]|uniref:hypothetical protein n=1 Tax=Acinetobacter TaxID=469 RepID=UPI000CFE852C|nr:MULTISPECIES: hypothetical protein [Acinetobacter]MCS4296859.1 hypothetical protein [Acinetobacter guillouiae]MCW2250981.1 hypothetical protein [Acinetobacter sp. BIGb0204]NII36921.1 hypothetical protein [Acinetobacter sp. BIGb0196]QLD60152.1 hypothetical protein CQZ96_002295 [Acinetobacter sp. MYb10]